MARTVKTIFLPAALEGQDYLKTQSLFFCMLRVPKNPTRGSKVIVYKKVCYGFFR